MTTVIPFNMAEHLRVTNINQLRSGRKYLMVHNRPEGDTEMLPPFCGEVDMVLNVWSSFNLIQSGHKLDTPHSLEKRWFFYYRTKRGWLTYSTASDHGLTDTTNAYTINYILDLEDLASRGIEISRQVSVGTDMTNYPDPHDAWVD